MRTGFSSMVVLLGLLSGCAAPAQQATPLVQRDLLLGPTPEVDRLAEAMTLARSDWPCAYLGYLTEDRSETYEMFVDDQSFFDDTGGGLYHEAAAFRVRSLRR